MEYSGLYIITNRQAHKKEINKTRLINEHA